MSTPISFAFTSLPDVIQCVPINLTWAGGFPPYSLEIRSEADLKRDFSKKILTRSIHIIPTNITAEPHHPSAHIIPTNITAERYPWIPNFMGGTSGHIIVTDSRNQFIRANFTVSPSTDYNCLGPEEQPQTDGETKKTSSFLSGHISTTITPSAPRTSANANHSSSTSHEVVLVTTSTPTISPSPALSTSLSPSSLRSRSPISSQEPSGISSQLQYTSSFNSSATIAPAQLPSHSASPFSTPGALVGLTIGCAATTALCGTILFLSLRRSRAARRSVAGDVVVSVLVRPSIADS